uniref:Protein kinase domain-containing protein n=1 Tax=Amphiprion ocellaris TaxID=80972 RepID=A0A3Q1CI73_AMPOC
MHTNSYYVEKLLGEGGFGVVARCMNVDTEEVVALKMFRKHIDKEHAEREIECLCKLKQLDADTHNVVKFIEHFEYKGRFCLIFEMLDLDLFDFLESRNWRPLNAAEIRPIAQQMLVALEGLKNIGLVHADMKPENIAFVDLCLSEFFKVKLIDFGCAIEVSELAEYDTIQNIGYRAPEVIMGLPLTEAVDMWSLGDVLAYMFLGELLYPTESEYERFFTKSHDSSGQFSSIDGMLHHSKKDRGPGEEVDTKAFLSLLKQMLHIDPKKRITPSAALRHRFITMKHLFVNNRFFIQYRQQALFLMARCDLRVADMGDIFTSSKVLSSNEASTSDDDTEDSTEASLDQGGTKDQITAVTHEQDKITKLTAPLDQVSSRNRTSTVKGKVGTDDHMTAPLVEVVENNRKSISRSKSGTQSQIIAVTQKQDKITKLTAPLDQVSSTNRTSTAVTHQEEKMTKLTAPLENPSLSDGFTKDKRTAAASLNILKDRPPQEVTVTNIEPAKNIMDKTNQNMQEDPSDIIEVTTKKKHFRRFRKFLSRVIKCFTCCRGVDDD